MINAKDIVDGQSYGGGAICFDGSRATMRIVFVPPDLIRMDVFLDGVLDQSASERARGEFNGHPVNAASIRRIGEWLAREYPEIWD